MKKISTPGWCRMGGMAVVCVLIALIWRQTQNQFVQRSTDKRSGEWERTSMMGSRPGESGASFRAGKRTDPPVVLRKGPRYDSFDEEGFINEQLLEFVGIPPDRRSEAQAVVDRIWAELSNDFQSRAVFVPEKSNDEAGVKTWFVPARPETRKAIGEKLRAKLAESFGSGPARELIPYLMRPDFFAGFGEYDLEVISHSVKIGRGDLVNVTAIIHISDALSGDLVSEHEIGNQLPYQQYLGDFMNEEISSRLGIRR